MTGYYQDIVSLFAHRRKDRFYNLRQFEYFDTD